MRWLLGLAVLMVGLVLCNCAPPNNSPIISSLETEKDLVMPSSSSKVKCIALDADGDILSYTWSATGGSFFGAGANITWVAPATPGTYAVTVTVTDGNGGEVKKQLTLGVRANHSPVIESMTANPLRVRIANTSVIQCTAFDKDGDKLTYTWEATGGSISGTGTTVTWTAPSSYGSFTIRV
ncbi:PKD domain-containing protein, partial [Chloroflexota bacterium]